MPELNTTPAGLYTTQNKLSRAWRKFPQVILDRSRKEAPFPQDLVTHLLKLISFKELPFPSQVKGSLLLHTFGFVVFSSFLIKDKPIKCK
jgi:hypothetical protein